MILTLIGYRGSGKTIVAQALQNRLALPAVDADHLIQNRAGCSIREMFQRQGEPFFRELEEQTLAELLARDNAVISAGGGAVLRQTTRDRMRAAGPVIWLEASVDELARRIAADQTSAAQRPSLTDSGLLQEIESVLKARLPLYAEAATHRVWTEGKTPDQIASEIIDALKLPEET